MQPTVGRIVHFYTRAPQAQSNGAGIGPYPAIVTRVWGNEYINLTVFPDFGAPRFEGSVEEPKPDVVYKDPSTGVETVQQQGRWWVWPPTAPAAM